MDNFPDRTVKPFRTRRVAKFLVTGEELAAKDQAAIERHSDVLGALLFQHVSDIESTFVALVSDSEYRRKLGRSQASLFESIEKMNPDGREATLQLCNYAMVKLLEEVLGTLSAGERAFPGGFCIEYSLKSHLLRITGASEDGVRVSEVTSCSISSPKTGSGLSEAFKKCLQLYRPSRRGA